MIGTILAILAAFLLASAPSIIVRAGFLAGPFLVIVGLIALGAVANLSGALP